MELTGRKFAWHSFAGQDFSKQNLSHSEFIHCDFTDCNLEDADCARSIFSGSDFTNANLRYTNFARSDLQNTKFFPRDAYGVIFSLECRTFKNMQISRLWWYSYMYFGLMQVPEKEAGVDPRNRMIAVMGERYKRLTMMFSRRGL